jgi:NAD(P)-dependent dehydrogenase (short-subunit alcohol dehydrogenase family)
MDLDLKGRRVLVTGASKGIGRACAEILRKEGCTVLGASRSIVGPDTKAIDIAAPGAAEELAGWAGDLDILVNNAGAIPGGDLLKVDEATWRKAWDLKLFGYMKAKRRGVIVNIIGAAGERMNAAYIAGSAANASLMAFTRALGGASHVDGIRVVGINPGPVETDRLVSLHRQMAQTKLGDADRYRELFTDMSFGRPATPEEIANAVAFLASDRSAYTSGAILTIDGGQSNRA